MSYGRPMRLASTILPALVLFGALVGCTKTKVTAGPDGLLRLDCARGMKDCVAQAEKYCNVQKKDGGYVIVSGTSRKILMGSENSQYRTAAEVAQLEVQCGSESLPIAAASEGPDYPSFKFPPRSDEGELPVEAAAVPVAAAATAAVACTKGSTQACVGPGGCHGGQVCLADGSGYGACDCGPAQAAPAPAAPGLSPAAPPPAAPPPSSGPEPLKKP